MEIYKVYLDGFRHYYTGYWSSMEEIFNNLPNCVNFQKSVDSFTPRYRTENEIHLDPDYNHNKTLPIKLDIEDSVINISIPGFKMQQTQVQNIPEVKEAGKPYEPAKRIETKLPDLYINQIFCKAYINVIKVDKLQND